MRDPVPGEMLDQYRLTDLLARSGMASIFKAIDTDSGEAVVLKIPHIQLECDVVFFDRFRREEELGQRLDHPGIVKVLRPRDKSRMYIAMEYVDGKSVRAMMQASRPLPADVALSIARQTCEALAYLHGQGIVHRDVKPENVLVTADGRVKILDLGIAHHGSKRRLTWAGSASGMGTPDYMAPEQIRGRRGDARTDVYALGTMLYEMLTCNLPFAGDDARALLRAKASDEPRWPSYHVPGFDPSLEAIVMKAIERSPDDRHASAAELLAELRDPSAVPPRDLEGASHRPRGPAARRRVVLSVVVAAVLAALASLVWLSPRLSAPPGPPPATAPGR